MRLSTLAMSVAIVAMLTGCQAMHRNVERANNSMYNGGKKTRAKLASYIYEEDAPPTQPPAPPQRYCYDVRADVVCYDQPKGKLGNQRVGTGEAEYAPDTEVIAVEEYEMSQVYSTGTQPNQGSMVGNPNANTGTFFNPARPNATATPFTNATNRPSGAFIPEAPPIRSVSDPVANKPTASKPFGFAQEGAVKASSNAPVSTMGNAGGGPETMNTKGPAPTRPMKGYEGAPSPLIQVY